MKKLLAMMLVVIAADPVSSEVITVQYEAEAATISGNPFGLDVPRLTVFSGTFSYDTSTTDTDTSTTSGVYEHFNVRPFTATFLGDTITGSTTPTFELLTAGTFRMYDGPSDVGLDGGVMSVNGVEDPTLELWISIVENSAAFSDDGLPNLFPPEFDFGFLGTPHTFSLSNDQGTVLLQIKSTEQIPEPATVMLATCALLGMAFWGRRTDAREHS